MFNHPIRIIIGIILILAVGFLVYTTKKPFVIVDQNIEEIKVESEELSTIDTKNTTVDNPVTKENVAELPMATQPAKTSDGITMDLVAKHSTRSSCWSVINGNVYDLTSWIPNHPGGEKRILAICGIDGSDAYNGAHGTRSKPAKILFGFKIGALVN